MSEENKHQPMQQPDDSSIPTAESRLVLTEEERREFGKRPVTDLLAGITVEIDVREELTFRPRKKDGKK